MKKFICLMLVFSMIFTLNISASADTEANMQNPLWELKTTKSGGEYLINCDSGEIIAKAFAYNENGELVELDLRDYLVLKNSLPNIADMISESGTLKTDVNKDAISPNQVSSWYYDYRETRTYKGLGDPIKVTADMKGPGVISHFNAATIEHSFGGDMEITGTIKNRIQIGASFDWHVSLASETSNGYQYNVPSGRVGYIQFTPYLNVTVGDLYYVVIAPFVSDETNLGEVWGASPKQIAGGFADGMYELVFK